MQTVHIRFFNVSFAHSHIDMPAENIRLESIKRRIQQSYAHRPTAFIHRQSATVLDLGDGTIVKYGPRVHKYEGQVLRMVQDHTTTVPLPKLVDIVTDPTTGVTYIVQQKLPGTLLSTIISTTDESTLENIGSELRTFLNELSKLDGDGKHLGLLGRPGCFDHGVFARYDRRNWNGGCMEGINTAEDFVRWIGDYTSFGLSREERDNYINEFQFHHPTIFSHGDLQPENILVNEGRVSGIIDWECAGWYPYFWNDYIATLKSDNTKRWEELVVTAMLECRYSKEVFAFRHLEFNADVYGN